MTPLETAQQRINECRTTRSTELDLSKLGLAVIPDEVFELTWLEKLDLSGEIYPWGEIKDIPSAIQIFVYTFEGCSSVIMYFLSYYDFSQ